MSILFHLKYHSSEWDFALGDDATYDDLKARVFALTAVEPSAQKLLGLFNRKPPPSTTTQLRGCLGVKLAPRINQLTLMGVTREQREQIQMFEATLVAEREAVREAQLEAERRAALAAEQRRLAREAEAEEARVAAEHAAEQQRRRAEAAAEQRRARRAERSRRDTAVDDENDVDDGFDNQFAAAVPQLNASFDDDATMDAVELRVEPTADDGRAAGVVGDKVLLPNALLVMLHNSRVRPPFVFRVALGERCVHVRALDFLADAGCIVMSPHLIADLGAASGAVVKIESVRLPPATKLQLQPAPAWIDLDPELRDAILHYELRNYATATLGGSLHVRYGNDDFSFRVCDVEPRGDGATSAVSLSDVDVEVDVIEPATLPPPIVALQVDAAAATNDCVASQATPAFFSLQLGDADVGQRFRVSVHATTDDADPDIFASQLTKRPSPVAYEWQAQIAGADEELLFVCGDGASQVHPNAPLYVAVTAYGGAQCRFSIALQRVAAEHRLNDGGAVLDGVECVWCGRQVPRASHALHELGCQRDNYVCQTCNETMPRRSRAKHDAVRHQRVKCSLGCGATLSQDEQATHRRETCRLRAVACLYCPMQVALLERGAHQNLCGNRTATCTRCEFSSKRNTMKRHVVEAHGVFPKDVRPSDWH